MNLATWIILGGVVGWLSHLMTGRGEEIVVRILMGIIAGAISCFMLEMVKSGMVIGANSYSFLLAVAGAILLLLVLGLVRK